MPRTNRPISVTLGELQHGVEARVKSGACASGSTRRANHVPHSPLVILSAAKDLMAIANGMLVETA